MTVQLRWQRADRNLSEIAAWVLRFDSSVELISSHYLSEKRFQSKSEGMKHECVCTYPCMSVFVSLCTEADNWGRSSAKQIRQTTNKCSTAETMKSSNCRNAVMRTLEWLLAIFSYIFIFYIYIFIFSFLYFSLYFLVNYKEVRQLFQSQQDKRGFGHWKI